MSVCVFISTERRQQSTPQLEGYIQPLHAPINIISIKFSSAKLPAALQCYFPPFSTLATYVGILKVPVAAKSMGWEQIHGNRSQCLNTQLRRYAIVTRSPLSRPSIPSSRRDDGIRCTRYAFALDGRRGETVFAVAWRWTLDHVGWRWRWCMVRRILVEDVRSEFLEEFGSRRFGVLD